MKEPSDGKGTRVRGIVKPPKPEAVETLETVKAQLAQAQAANQSLVNLLNDVSTRCIDIGVNIKAALRQA